jgi:hypothetical protein
VLCVVTADNVYSMLHLTDEYQVEKYKTKCAQVLLRNFTFNLSSHQPPSDAELLKLLVTAETYNLKILFDKCFDVAANRLHTNLKSEPDYDDITDVTARALIDERLARLEKEICCSEHHVHSQMRTSSYMTAAVAPGMTHCVTPRSSPPQPRIPQSKNLFAYDTIHTCLQCHSKNVKSLPPTPDQ